MNARSTATRDKSEDGHVIAIVMDHNKEEISTCTARNSNVVHGFNLVPPGRKGNVSSSRADVLTIAFLSFAVLLYMNTGPRADSVDESMYTGIGGCSAFGESISRAVWSWCYHNDQNNMTECNLSHISWAQTVEKNCNTIRQESNCLPDAQDAVKWHFHGRESSHKLVVHVTVNETCDTNQIDETSEFVENNAHLTFDGEMRRRIQLELSAQGFGPGQPDGVFGANTKKAIEAWQMNNHYPVTGKLTVAQAGVLLTAETPPEYTLTGKTANFFGAIVLFWSATDDYTLAFAWNEDDAGAAQRAALEGCKRQTNGGDCRTVGWSENSCGAIATGDHKTVTIGWSNSAFDSEEAALAKCRNSQLNCKVVASRCAEDDLGMPDTSDLWGYEPNWTISWDYEAPTPESNLTVLWSGNYVDGDESGRGRHLWRNGFGENVYDGEYRDGKRHGFGVYRWSNQDRYEGEWDSGKRQGSGVYYWPGWTSYEGEFMNNMRHGYGIYHWFTGWTTTCEWYNNDSIEETCEGDRPIYP